MSTHDENKRQPSNKFYKRLEECVVESVYQATNRYDELGTGLADAVLDFCEEWFGDEREIARNQPCGCVVCRCEDEEQCQGCGAKSCGTHPGEPVPDPVYVSDDPASDKHAELGLSDGEHVCDTCEGEGTVDETLGGEYFSDPEAKCPDCDGAGWWADREPTDDGVLTGAALWRDAAESADSGGSPYDYEVLLPEGWGHVGEWTGLFVADKQGKAIRRKPTTRHLIDQSGVRHEWPEPMREAPSPQTSVFLTLDFYRDHSYPWHTLGGSAQRQWLAQGRCHATREARDAHERALIAASGGQS